MKRRFFPLVALLLVGLVAGGVSGSGHAAGQYRAASTNTSASLRGTWHSAKETLTFRQDGTIVYKGKRYYYAVSSGGTIQLTGKQGSLTIPYQLAGGKLTLTVDGNATVYTRRRHKN